MKEKYEDEVRVCIAIQKLGKATPREIAEKLLEGDIKLSEKKISRLCDNLQKKGIVSIGYVEENGLSAKSFSMAKSIFKRDIPIAHYKDITDYPEAKELIKELEMQKGTSKGRLPDHRDYYSVEVKWEVMDSILGFMPFKEQGFNQHYRNNEGKIIFLPIHFRAYLKKNLRLINKSESLKDYIGYAYGEVELKGDVRVEQFPVLDGNQGRGIIKYEAIPKGSVITTKFILPESDFKKEDFRKFLQMIGEMPLRGFGGRAVTGYGHLKLVHFAII